jgi:hypothetical protein
MCDLRLFVWTNPLSRWIKSLLKIASLLRVFNHVSFE